MKALIFAAGERPSSELIKSRKADYIIAADGACAYLREEGIVPDYLIGDFDSSKEEDVEFMREKGAKIIFLPVEKDDTDSLVAIKKAMELGCSEGEMLGFSGGRLDHTLANILSMLWAFRNGFKLTLVSNNEKISAFEGKQKIDAKAGDTLSLFAFEDAYIEKSEGLKYIPDGITLNSFAPIGVSNVALKDFPSVTSKGIVMVSVLNKA